MIFFLIVVCWTLRAGCGDTCHRYDKNVVNLLETNGELLQLLVKQALQDENQKRIADALELLAQHSEPSVWPTFARIAAVMSVVWWFTPRAYALWEYIGVWAVGYGGESCFARTWARFVNWVDRLRHPIRLKPNVGVLQAETANAIHARDEADERARTAENRAKTAEESAEEAEDRARQANNRVDAVLVEINGVIDDVELSMLRLTGSLGR